MEISHNHLITKSYPQSLSFSKMETLVKEMQHPQSGVPVKSQKLFLTTIPNAFTGEDLIDWMTSRLDIKDIDEALHLATILCRYGYFFRVTSSDNYIVKNDSELYRFQAPYFWSTTNWNVGNMDYAIFLVKRTMRNQEKHGLNEHEYRVLDELKKKLTHQWDFIRMQADAQLRVLKERKKQDKTIIDSQEKAFWNITKPMTDNGNSALDQDIKVTLMHSNQKLLKSIDLVRKKVKFFQQTLKSRVRTKSSQLLPNLCAFCEAYNDYDGLLVTPLPSNPWISEDTTFWTVNSDLVDNPTQLRVKRWSFSFKELLSDPTGVKAFIKYCESEFSVESLRFYLSCQNFKKAPTTQLPELAKKIYDEHLSSDSGSEVNINDGIRLKIVKKLENNLISRDMFIEAEKHIYELMKKNSYSRFEQSEQYKELLANAIIPIPKKTGIFHFVKRDYFRSSDDSSDYDSDVDDNIDTNYKNKHDDTTHNNNNNNYNYQNTMMSVSTRNFNFNNTITNNSTNVVAPTTAAAVAAHSTKPLSPPTMTGSALVGAVENASAVTAAVASITSPPLTKLTLTKTTATNMIQAKMYEDQIEITDETAEFNKSKNQHRKSSIKM